MMPPLLLSPSSTHTLSLFWQKTEQQLQGSLSSRDSRSFLGGKHCRNERVRPHIIVVTIVSIIIDNFSSSSFVFIIVLIIIITFYPKSKTKKLNNTAISGSMTPYTATTSHLRDHMARRQEEEITD
jgi:hypothetical protein